VALLVGFAGALFCFVACCREALGFGLGGLWEPGAVDLGGREFVYRAMTLAIQVGADDSDFAGGYGRSLDTGLALVKTALNEDRPPVDFVGGIELICPF